VQTGATFCPFGTVDATGLEAGRVVVFTTFAYFIVIRTAFKLDRCQMRILSISSRDRASAVRSYSFVVRGLSCEAIA
jgi:hypothetical protein